MGTEKNEIHHPDGRAELADETIISQSPLFNHDLAPVRVANRTWRTYNFAALWISMAHCIPTYMLASSLMGMGMNWTQALFTILLGNTIVLVPILLNSHPGTKYGIPFPIFARASYGVFGSNLAALMRALVACGWFGIQSWLGGEALHSLCIALGRALSGNQAWADPTLIVGGHSVLAWSCFLGFWGLNIWVIFRGMEMVRHVEDWAAPFVLIMTGLLCVWVYQNAGGLEPIARNASGLETGKFWAVFLPALTGMIGYWATLSLNMPDFTRFGHSQKEQAFGQVVALPSTMVVFAAMGIFITSGANVIFAAKLPPEKLKELWDPMKLALQFDNFWAVAISMFTVVVATLAVNIAANVVSPANDFSNAFPKLIDFKTGGLITGILGIAIMPWKLLADPEGYVFSWLGGYSGGLAAIAGVMIVDYWVIRKTRLYLADLYLEQGVYTYDRGWNWAAVQATVWGCLVSWSGYIAAASVQNSRALIFIAIVLIYMEAFLLIQVKTVPTGLVGGLALIWWLGPIYPKLFSTFSDAAWIVGLVVSGGLYYILARPTLEPPEGFAAVAPSKD
ncbi:MAG: NCS1 family nucleobase:cation symporter-1 [Candidatus Wallbacteria bacterium]|nr:NCS1 family nucleobase:cation symporter-1 [Candidatus Wallbacteria bacterium]